MTGIEQLVESIVKLVNTEGLCELLQALNRAADRVALEIPKSRERV
jgi:hypothetical protein